MSKCRYNPNEVASLDRLRRTDLRTFIELCEKAGYISIAYDFYSTRRDEKDLMHAVEIALKLTELSRESKIDLVKRLKSSYQSGLREAVPSRGLGGDWADAYSQDSADRRRKDYSDKLKKISDIEKELGL